MKITDVEVGWGFTKNVGNYESERAYVAYTCQVGQNETHQEVLEKLEKMAKVQVKRIIRNKIEQKQKTAEDYY